MDILKRIHKSNNDPTRIVIGSVRIDENEIPLWEVSDMFGLVKLIGHAKYKNQSYGSVLLRGQNQDYGSMKPAAYRDADFLEANTTVDDMVKKLKMDTGLSEDKTISKFIKATNNLSYEAVLQHYCYNTRLLDVVDNQWVALWFASHYRKSDKEFYSDNNSKQLLEGARYIDSPNKYSYIYLFGIPESSTQINNSGIINDHTHCLIDIRRACPSTILRPHMQHALVIGFYDEKNQFKESYADQLICIIRIETKICLNLLDGDKTLTPESLFPCPAYDFMYNLILDDRKDLFNSL